MTINILLCLILVNLSSGQLYHQLSDNLYARQDDDHLFTESVATVPFAAKSSEAKSTGANIIAFELDEESNEDEDILVLDEPFVGNDRSSVVRGILGKQITAGRPQIQRIQFIPKEVRRSKNTSNPSKSESKPAAKLALNGGKKKKPTSLFDFESDNEYDEFVAPTLDIAPVKDQASLPKSKEAARLTKEKLRSSRASSSTQEIDNLSEETINLKTNTLQSDFPLFSEEDYEYEYNAATQGNPILGFESHEDIGQQLSRRVSPIFSGSFNPGYSSGYSLSPPAPLPSFSPPEDIVIPTNPYISPPAAVPPHERTLFTHNQPNGFLSLPPAPTSLVQPDIPSDFDASLLPRRISDPAQLFPSISHSAPLNTAQSIDFDYSGGLAADLGNDYGNVDVRQTPSFNYTTFANAFADALAKHPFFGQQVQKPQVLAQKALAESSFKYPFNDTTGLIEALSRNTAAYLPLETPIDWIRASEKFNQNNPWYHQLAARAQSVDGPPLKAFSSEEDLDPLQPVSTPINTYTQLLAASGDNAVDTEQFNKEFQQARHDLWNPASPSILGPNSAFVYPNSPSRNIDVTHSAPLLPSPNYDELFNYDEIVRVEHDSMQTLSTVLSKVPDVHGDFDSQPLTLSSFIEPVSPGTAPTSSVPAPSISPLCKTAAPLDLVMVVDGSGSIDNQQFQQVRQFMTQMVNIVPVGTQVAAVQFSTGPRSEFGLNQYRERKRIVDHIAQMAQLSGSTSIGAALKYVFDSELIPAAGDRINVPNAVLVITDGISDDDPLQAANSIRQTGARTISIGVGDSVNAAQLLAIAGEPKRVFQIPSFEQLDKHLANVVFRELFCPNQSPVVHISHSFPISSHDQNEADNLLSSNAENEIYYDGYSDEDEGQDFEISEKQNNAAEVTQQEQHFLCCFWASTGACSRNPQFMTSNCENACSGNCGCRNEHPLCEFWANRQRCQTAPISMFYICRKACLLC